MMKAFVMRHLSFMFLLGLLLHGCARDHIISRPTIEKNPQWEMVESCGYEGCTPMVDFLSSKDIRIRIEAFNHVRNPNLFVIGVGFFGLDYYDLKSDEFTFDLSLISAKLSNGMILKPKVFTCSYTIWDLNHMRSKPSLGGQIRIVDNSCFTLFFDYSPPSVEEEFIMNLGGLKRKGQPAEVPMVIFKKGVSRY
ncbi:MAG: hypothetical protein WA133_14375 [Syntrophales bacterium]